MALSNSWSVYRLPLTLDYRPFDLQAHEAEHSVHLAPPNIVPLSSISMVQASHNPFHAMRHRKKPHSAPPTGISQFLLSAPLMRQITCCPSLRAAVKRTVRRVLVQKALWRKFSLDSPNPIQGLQNLADHAESIVHHVLDVQHALKGHVELCMRNVIKSI